MLLLLLLLLVLLLLLLLKAAGRFSIADFGNTFLGFGSQLAVNYSCLKHYTRNPCVLDVSVNGLGLVYNPDTRISKTLLSEFLSPVLVTMETRL